jgi:hypothetical protein
VVDASRCDLIRRNVWSQDAGLVAGKEWTIKDATSMVGMSARRYCDEETDQDAQAKEQVQNQREEERRRTQPSAGRGRVDNERREESSHSSTLPPN